ncbi:MAG: polyprenyl synthetase family protein [Parvibaculales bacterium]
MAEIINFSESARPTDDALTDLHKLFATDLDGVEAEIAKHMQSAAEMIPAISDHLIGAGGKRLRPLLTLSAARLAGYQGKHHVTMAAAVEYMHTATLLHDDVVDDSDMRRGKPTARRLWGNAASVLVGDFLLGQAFRMMVSAESLTALDILSNAAAIIAEGEVMQLAAMNNAQISEDQYLQIIDAKTAALFAAAAEVGGVIGDAPKAERTALTSYGRNLGIAFQLVDDALDYGSVGQVLGKNTGEDFREGKMTLPVILAYHRGDSAARSFWEEVVANPSDEAHEENFAQALAHMQKTNALADAVARAAHYGEKARDALGLFPQSETRTLLLRLIDFCLARAY